MLLQKRSRFKYHSGGLWSNACCSHPRPYESLEVATYRRLKEEMSISCDMSCNLEEIYSFIYYVEFENGLKEHEIDHVYIGEYSGVLSPDPAEVEDFKWVDLEELINDVREREDQYTYWFKLALPKVISYYLYKKSK